jgi:trehalose-6-phosphate synthase
MSETLYQALTMGADEVAYRAARLAMIVDEHDVRRWGDGFLAALEQPGAAGDVIDERPAA